MNEEEKKKAKRTKAKWIAFAALFIYVIIYLLLIAFIHPLPEHAQLSLCSPQIVAFLVTALLPPVWFFIEAVFIYGDGHGEDEDFTHNQELASRIWLALSALAGLYWFHGIAG
jgi:hypothetical protein